jgi:hypothetical protein
MSVRAGLWFDARPAKHQRERMTMAKKKKHWSEVVEAHGIQVVVHARAGTKQLYYSITHGGRRFRGPLKTTAKKTAKENAKAVAEEIAKATLTGQNLSRITLGQVFTRFFDPVHGKAPAYTERWRRSAETRRELFEAAWGAEKRVEDIGQPDMDRFAHLRRTGQIASETSKVKKVRDGTIEADLRWLSTVFRWARGVKINGKRLLPFNPLEGLERPKELNPRQPKASHDRFVKTLAKTDDVRPQGTPSVHAGPCPLHWTPGERHLPAPGG